MKMGFHWFDAGGDNITLEQIKQIPGCDGVIGAPAGKATGDLWTYEESKAYVDRVTSACLECEVLQVVAVHEDIKLGLPTRDAYIETYCKSVENLGKAGIKVIEYSFMPVFDWLRTDLMWRNPLDNTYCLYYDEEKLRGMTPLQVVENITKNSSGFSMAGWDAKQLAKLQNLLDSYRGFTKDMMLENLRYFLDAVLPVCEKAGIRLALHPDDPAWPIFDLPRIVHSQADYDKIMALSDSPANAICICTGSLASDANNDIPAIIRHFGKAGRVALAHIRNIKATGYRQFHEAPHISAAGDIDIYECVKAFYETAPGIWLQSDHGRMIWGEKGRPGFGLYDRALGMTYILGLWEAVAKSDSSSN